MNLDLKNKNAIVCGCTQGITEDQLFNVALSEWMSPGQSIRVRT